MRGSVDMQQFREISRTCFSFNMVDAKHLCVCRRMKPLHSEKVREILT